MKSEVGGDCGITFNSGHSLTALCSSGPLEHMSGHIFKTRRCHFLFVQDAEISFVSGFLRSSYDSDGTPNNENT